MQNLSIKPINQRVYASWGLGLMLAKYAIEYLVVTQFGGEGYSLLAFLTPVSAVRADSIVGAESWVAWFILAWSLPFVFTALWLSMRRALDAGYSPWLSLWILCPVANLFFMLTMCCVASSAKVSSPPSSEASANDRRDAGLWLSTILTGLALTTGVIVVSVYALNDYGATIFFSTPVLLGVICGYSQKQYMRTSGIGPAILISIGAVLLGCGVLVALAMEGIVCIVMALPIMVPAAAVGGLIGYLIASATAAGPAWMTIVLLCPSAALVEHALTQPIQYEVVSVVEVAASPSEVWDTVIAFPEIDAPPGWLFRLGVAYPVRARIDGQGVGATRYCEFSTGDFVEPITTWQQPSRLAFAVQEQPCPLTELSPYGNIHPPHLDGFMRSYKGEFRLIELPDGRTRLEGHTWYSVDMYPQMYWKIWTDSIIHSIHHRVLEHIREVVEAK